MEDIRRVELSGEELFGDELSSERIDQVSIVREELSGK
jgi:hypothetical protein